MADTQPIVFVAVMAAGRSSRFGSTKQIAELDGMPLVRRATKAARQVCGANVLTVIGHDQDKVLAALGHDSGFVVVNDNYETGLSGSIARAVTACRDDADGVLVVLADQPLVTPAHLQHLIDDWSGRGDEIVATAYAGTRGPPVLFGKDAFADLVELPGDTGASTLLNDARYSLKTVLFEAAASDVDTPADLATIS